MILLANIDLHDGLLLVAGVGLGILLLRWADKRRHAAAKHEQDSLLSQAQREAESITREARLHATEETLALRSQMEQAFAARERELGQSESRLTEREKLINGQFERLVGQEKVLRTSEEAARTAVAAAEARQGELAELSRQRREQLASLSRMTEEEATTQLLQEMEKEVQSDASAFTRHIIEEARLRAEDKAHRLLALAIQRYAGDHTSEHTTASVALPSDELKGRIIGRDGRNIRAFEAATGVTVLIDDTPNAVVLAAFDPIRREIARAAMERLLADGRIHPTRIEEVILKVRQEMDESIVRFGEEAVARVGVPPLHPELVKLLGALKFRRSFSQNVLEHSIEVAQLTGLLAGELGMDVTLAKRIGLLHDIGKAVSHEVEGTHAQAGAELLKLYGEADAVVSGVSSHHDEVPQNGPLAVLVSAADAISASRPGARSETMAIYLKRVEDLEKIGLTLPGVEKVYAVQAGRELRVFVHPEAVSDEEAYTLARNLARKIESELHYPGQIRVTVMRETRCVEFAK
ncbi:MAG: ribonuclease Y [Verrucomicrobia bacterium]|nr:ribonuclease Y [Verrucomicrobiota bacterium]